MGYRKGSCVQFPVADEIMSRDVVTIHEDEPVDEAARKMEGHSISALPVVDEDRHIIGLITSDAISTLIGRQVP